MKPSESSGEDNSNIYNSLPVELFTNEFDDEMDIGMDDADFDSDDKDFPSDDLITDFRDLTRSHSPDIPIEDLNLSEEPIGNETSVLPSISLASIQEPIPPSRSSSQSLPPATANGGEESGLWIRCNRCGKKNDLDCNFCGKCGLQIHKVVSIAEADTDTEITNPEVTRNIKYHYKRPVFCFGPRGNCFASFSSPSKSVRNVVKFKLSTLPEFKSFLESQTSGKIITGEYDKLWSEEGFTKVDWAIKQGFLRSLSAILAGQSGFILDESLRLRLLDFFASIAPKDLGSIKNLAVQDTVRYSRPDIDEIFHKLVLGQIKEACEECISFNYWDHALIIAKTLDTAFYENVMNRFLNARFSNGHPLRTLYLIMTSNENAALDEIRGIIADEGTVSFVKDIWAVLCNFLLRAKPGVSNICTIFEDIGNCLFDQKLYENALICYTIAVLTGAKFDDATQLVDRVDFLLSWFISVPEHETINFAGIRIVDLLTEKLSSMHSNTILWRCQFVKLLFNQYLYDMDSFDRTGLIPLTQARRLGKTQSRQAKLVAEECKILCARQVVEEDSTFRQETPQFANNFQPPSSIKSPSLNPSSPQQYFSPAPAAQFTPTTAIGAYEPIQSSNQPMELAPAPPLINDSRSNSITPPASGFATRTTTDQLEEDNTHLESKPSQQQGQEKHRRTSSSSPSKQQNESEGLFTKWKIWSKNDNAKNDQQKPVVAKMGQKNTLRYDAKLKKWVDDNDPSTFEEAPKLAPPPVAKVAPSPMSPAGPTTVSSTAPVVNTTSFRAKKGKLKYFDPLNPDADSAAPTIPSFNDL